MSPNVGTPGPPGHTPAAYEVLTATVCAWPERRRVGLVLAPWCWPPSGWRCRRSSDWDVHVRWFPPLHADWDPRVGWGTVPAVVLAVLAWRYAVDLAARLSWGRLLGAAYAGGLAWMLALALVDGVGGVGDVLDHPYEYLRHARGRRPTCRRRWPSTSAGSPSTPPASGPCTSPATRRAR